MKRLITMITAFAMILCMVMTFVVNAFALTADGQESTEETSTVVVWVYANNHDEDYIKSIPFDDGTVVGDYNYSIKYVTQKTRDPIYITYYFDYAGWIERDGVVSLSLDPSDDVRASAELRDVA